MNLTKQIYIKRKALGSFAVAMLLMLLSSCSAKQAAINDLRRLDQKMELYGNQYTLNDWKQAAQDYYNINQRIKEHAGDYTDQQMQEISELNGRCLRAFTEGAVQKVNGAVNMIKNFIEGFQK